MLRIAHSALLCPFLIAVTLGCLVSGGCGGYSAEEKQAAESLKQLGALVIAEPDGRPAQSVSLGTEAVKGKLDEAMPLVAQLHHLEALTLDSAPATDAHLEHLKGLSKLHGLVLSGTKVTDAGIAKLKDLDELEKLELAQTAVTDACLASVAELASLNMVNLSGTKMTGDLAPLAEMPHLEWVLLIDTELSDAALATLARTPKLSRLSIAGARFNEAALDEFRKAKPTADVNR